MTYELVKELPGISVGNYAEKNIAGEYVFNGLGMQLRVSANIVENNPEWFRQHDPKEFTRQDMLDFAKYSSEQYRGSSIANDFERWLKKRNSK